MKGKYNLFKNLLTISFISFNVSIKNHIKAIYKYKNISDKAVTFLLKQIFQHPQLKIKENLNSYFLKKYNLLSRKEALQNLHLPLNQKKLQQSFLRFKYEEAYKIISKWHKEQQELPTKEIIRLDIHQLKKIIKQIPFQLTQNQKQILNDVYRDFQKQTPIQRLIQGDVGSGKTIIAFLAALGIIFAKKQVIMMSPTEILAKQHYFNFKKLFPNIKTILLTSKSTKKKLLIDNIKNNHFEIIFGTHFLANIDYYKIGLIIIDEIHKFGTEIKQKTINKNFKADVLYLTATPIPRTLASIYFNFLSISSLKEKPYDKKNIITQKCSFPEIIKILKQNQARNEQTYIVVPAIQDNKKYFNIQKIIPFLEKNQIKNVYVLHGKKKSKEQEQIMNNFINDDKGILLTTSIIEVGIDISNATTIIILGAEYFGLSQLHQLRGRVGRNQKKNFCFLVTKKNSERLNILEKENDGFKLSIFDLKHRGPGDFLGKEQSGFFKYHFLDILRDFNIIDGIKKEFLNLQKNIILKKEYKN
ncbi:DEAD/DEAH box helicase [Candidatus Phytoplasma pini]|uniref:DEAD/DEAH box helicase n=1 Tax=Candidatus Phytoplasma pini TaxID=267362 RepID=UPI001FE48951|nr:DEAD/DEAH box helicase [Candidatus Phytoplasma pini]